MTLPHKHLADQEVRRNFEAVDGRFPIQTQDIADGTVTDTDLASPNNSVYRYIFWSKGVFAADTAAGTYMLGSYLNLGTINPMATTAGSTLALSGLPDIFPIFDEDFTVAGKTTKLRLRAAVIPSTHTQTGVTYTFGLYPFTAAGGTDDINVTLGTVVSGSTAVVDAPAADTPTYGVGSDFNIPTGDAGYVLGVVTDATLTANAASLVYAYLQMRHT